ncbi:MAG: class I SAM-dependent methyltransferase [Alphaproteobacteria bacterium]
MSHYDTYGRMAQSTEVSSVTQNGRYKAQQDAELHVPDDVIRKLQPTSQDHFLDVGCGLGLNLRPVSQMVETATGCDHPNVIAKLKQASPDIQADLVGGNFLELDFAQKYTKILAYSVVPALPDMDTVYAFIDKTLSILDPAGRVLLGDLANVDKKKRFLDSTRGQVFQKKWEELSSGQQQDDDISVFQTEQDRAAVVMNDAVIFDLVGHIRKQGFHAYIVDQPQNLPFGNTREDIVIIGPEYEDQ